MPFAAFDLHKQHTQAIIVSDAGDALVSQRFPTTRDALVDFAKQHLTKDCILAMESTFNTWPVAELMAPFVKEVVISNPMRTRAIAEAKVKTDKVDALVLVTLLRLDYLPRVWQPDADTQLARRRSTERAMLVADRTRIKNRIHAVLHQRLLTPPVKELFSAAGLLWLEQLKIDEQGRESLHRQLRLLAQIEGELGDVNQRLAEHAYHDPRIKLLMTMPGVDFAVAETVLAAIGDIGRFPDADKAAAYLGLTPSVRQSGNHCYHGPITKQGHSHARWMLVQAAQQMAKNPGPLGVFFRRIAKRKNRNVAVVATARKLVTIAWHMLRNNEPYRYALPATASAKLARLRVKATGKRKRGGNAKGTGRHPNYGQGLTKAVPALTTVYEVNELSPVNELKAGEKAMLERAGLADLPEYLNKPRRVPKKKTAN